jgi:dihydropyrimidine dehydrogenase (NAD+) subunit PreA
MIQQVNADHVDGPPIPMSGIGGVSDWRDAVEFFLLGCGTVQVCTAAMHYGFRIVEDMIDGLSNWMDAKGFASVEDFRGLSLPRVTEWKHLNLNYRIVAEIDESLCIGCQLCHIACWDGAHQCIHLDRTLPAPNIHRTPDMVAAESRGRISTTPIPKLDLDGPGLDGPYRTPLARIPRVDEEECVGCNLCSLVCPVPDCITMERVENGLPQQSWDERVREGMVADGAAVAGNPNL